MYFVNKEDDLKICQLYEATESLKKQVDCSNCCVCIPAAHSTVPYSAQIIIMKYSS